MEDLFWNEYLELKKFKGFEYEENSFFPIEVQRKYPKLFHTYKSAMFLIQRNFFISHAENYNDIDLGDFKVLWRPEGDFSKMIEEICLSFKLMYKLSYNCGR